MDAEVTISSIVLIVILVVPGIFFKRFYYQGSFSKQFGWGLFADRLITSIFWGFVIQIISFLIFSAIFNLTYDSIKGSITDVYNEVNDRKLPDFSTKELWYILGYLFSSIFIASVLGGFFHSVVRALRIDIRFPVFRFANQWHYYFKGEILNSTDFKKYRKGKWLSTLVDALVENGDGTNKMVSGFLTQYLLSSRTGELEVIYLTEAKRYSKKREEFVDIPGDCLIIPYSKIIDLNIRYNVITEDKQKKNQAFNLLFPLFSFAVLFFILIYPFFLDVNIWARIVGIILSILDWMLLIALINSLFSGNPKEKLALKDIFWIVFIVVGISTGILFLYNFI